MCVVVGYASYSYCNEISQVQLYLKMLRLKHSAGGLIIYPGMAPTSPRGAPGVVGAGNTLTPDHGQFRMAIYRYT